MILLWLVLLLIMLALVVAPIGAVVVWLRRPIADDQTYFVLHGTGFTTYYMDVNEKELEYHLIKTGESNDYNDRDSR
jgi:hypothetical protein